MNNRIPRMTIPVEDKRYEKYLMYSLPQDEQVAVQNFKKRFGYQPDEIFNWHDRYLLVGPVKEGYDE